MPALDDLVPATTSGSGIAASGRRLLEERCRVELALQRHKLAAHALRRRHELIDRRQRRRHGGEGSGRDASIDVDSGRRGEETGQDALRLRTFGGRCGAVGLDVDHLALGAKSIEAGGLACRFAAAEHVGKLAQLIAAARQFPLARLRRPQIGECQPQIGAEPSHRVIGPARGRFDARGRGAHLEAAPAGDRQQLRHHHHVLGDAGDRFAVEGHPRIRPSAGREDVGPRDVDGGANGLHPRTFGRQPRQRLGLGQLQRLGAGARRQQRCGKRSANNTRAHGNLDSDMEKDRRRLSRRNQDGKAGGAREAAGRTPGGSWLCATAGGRRIIDSSGAGSAYRDCGSAGIRNGTGSTATKSCSPVARSAPSFSSSAGVSWGVT